MKQTNKCEKCGLSFECFFNTTQVCPECEWWAQAF